LASAYIAKKEEIRKALRGVRAALRTNDTLGEKIERDLDRLIARKTMITPEQLANTVQRISTFIQMAQQVAAAIQAVMSVMQ
jgi:hypothetical protein